MTRNLFEISKCIAPSTRFAATLALLAAIVTLAASPARADRCDDLATQLKSQIDGLGVGKTAANVIYLSHPLAKQITLGCAGRTYANQLFAKANVRKPPAAFQPRAHPKSALTRASAEPSH